MKKILVTGANGVIGSRVLKALSENSDFKLFAMYNSSQSNIKNIPGLLLKQADLTKEINCNDKMDVVIHCAAAIPVSFDDNAVAEVNKTIDKNVINFSLGNGSRLIYCSSSSVYNGKQGMWSEQDEVNPDNPYSKEKLFSEKRIKSECRNYTILRINAPYHYTQKNSTVLKKFILNALSGADLILYGSGQRQQNFIHADDVASLVQKMVVMSGVNGTYNAGGDNNISMENLAKMIIRISNSNSKIVYAGIPDPNENRIPNLNTDPARKAFSWHCRVSLEDGIKEWISEIKK